MGPTESGSEGLSKINLHPSPILCGLPDDIALLCLARIPRKYHGLLKCVSKRWRELVCSEEWHSYRQKHNLSETWIYALCRDKFDQLCCYVLDTNDWRRGWKPIQVLPAPTLKRKGMGFQVLGDKIYLLGGCGWIEDATDEVYCYDSSSNKWNEAAPLSTPRCYFSCETLGDKIFAIGGLGSKSSDPHSWDTYDCNTQRWESHVDPNIIPDTEDSVVLDGKIYIRCGSSSVSSHVYAVVYEPSHGIWQHADLDLASGWRGPAVVLDGTLYVLDQSSGTKLMMWQKEIREWVAVGRLASQLTKPPCRLVAVGKNIFVIGKWLSTVMLNVDTLGNTNGVLVTSSVPKFTYAKNVISCKSITI